MNISETEIDKCKELIPAGVVAILPGDHYFPVLKFGQHPETGRGEVHLIAKVTDPLTKGYRNQEVIIDLEDVKKLTIVH